MGCADAEAHAFPEDDWEEVGDGVCNGSYTTVVQLVLGTYVYSKVWFYMPSQEDQRKSPNLHVQSGFQEPLQREGFRVTVIAISVNPSNDECAFLFSQEPEGLVRSVWEVD